MNRTPDLSMEFGDDGDGRFDDFEVSIAGASLN
jgi:hypothetical protein